MMCINAKLKFSTLCVCVVYTLYTCTNTHTHEIRIYGMGENEWKNEWAFGKQLASDRK